MAKNAVYAPLQLLKSMTQKYPGAWEMMADFHDHNGENGLPSWDRRVYAPVAAAYAVVMNARGIDILSIMRGLEIMPDVQCLAALAPWRLSKEVYVPDQDLLQLLAGQDDDLDIPCGLMMDLPYPCFYVDCALPEDPNVVGFFVHLEEDSENHERELRLLFLYSNGSAYGFPVHLDDQTLKQSMDRVLAQARQNIEAGTDLHERKSWLSDHVEISDSMVRLVSQALNVVLYILAENADIAPDSEQGMYTKRGSQVRDRYSEIRKWDVGWRVGASIRKANSAPRQPAADSVPGTHASPRPHMRRGHWHHFWTGPKDGERKLILRWVAPTYIGYQEDGPATIHHI